jgi:diguanylate cyclase (GGDEF)-like protein
MRAATIVDCVRAGTTSVPYAFLLGVLPAVGALTVLGWFWPTTALAVALVLLAVCGVAIVLLYRRVRELTDRDPLTSVASRAGFSGRLRRAIKHCIREGRPVSVAVLDCDDFKLVNERYGHAVGDEVLVEVADVLATMVRETGTVGRLWGDAFGLVLPGASLEVARRMLRETEVQLRTRMSARGWPVTFSIGVSSHDDLRESGEELLAEADALMFAVKRRGRNGIACRDLEEPPSTTTTPRMAELARQP